MPLALDHPDLQGLADFCARRFGDASTRTRLAAEAGIESEVTDPGDDRRAWSLLLERAQAQGRVPRLVGVLARSAPEDENLREVARCFEAEPARRWPAWMAAGAILGVVALVGIGSLSVWAWAELGSAPNPNPTPQSNTTSAATSATPPSPTAQPNTTVAAAPSTTVASPAPAGPAAPAATASPSPPDFPAARASAPPVIETSPKSDQKNASPGAMQADAQAGSIAAGTTHRCTVPGALAGYWYAGDASPGTLGTQLTLPTSVRVRADYPRRENGHNAATSIQCVLKAGTVVTLGRAPVHVAGGKWWVPYVVGSAG